MSAKPMPYPTPWYEPGFYYSLTYGPLRATTPLHAIEIATGLLRTDCRVRGVNSVEEVRPGWWQVSLNVEERA